MPDRETYLTFLDSQGYEEHEVASSNERYANFMLADERRRFDSLSKSSPEEMAALDGFLSNPIAKALLGHKDRTSFIESMKRRSAAKYVNAKEGTINDLLTSLESNLRSELLVLQRPEERPAGHTFPHQIFPGVFPTRSFNAQAVSRGSGYLVLIDSLTVPILDILARIQASSLPTKDKVTKLKEVLSLYIEGKDVEQFQTLADSIEIGFPDHVVGELFKALLEFVICHEYGHCARHLNASTEPFRLLNSKLDEPVIKRSKIHEFEADTWAFSLIHHRCELALRNDPKIRYFKYAGQAIFLSFAALLEIAFRKAGVEFADTHPPAEQRLWVAAKFSTLIDRTDWYKIGWDFLSVVEEVAVDCFGQTFEPAPTEHSLYDWLSDEFRTLETLKGL